MGCLNDTGIFAHWFGNIHLSGPCNRSCYFCIGQHMMALDPLNVLKSWPLPSIDTFVQEITSRGIREINVTGSNTDPLLYERTMALRSYLDQKIPGLILGIRTNGIATSRYGLLLFYDKGSVTVCSFDKEINGKMMGGPPVDIVAFARAVAHFKSLKANIVLGPENVAGDDLFRTIERCKAIGVEKINLREPYGQPHVGDPMAARGIKASGVVLGMPKYEIDGVDVTYWDVHYVEVESVNLYANGRVSLDYPVTKGHDPQGKVEPQDMFIGGRVRQQWL